MLDFNVLHSSTNFFSHTNKPLLQIHPYPYFITANHVFHIDIFINHWIK